MLFCEMAWPASCFAQIDTWGGNTGIGRVLGVVVPYPGC